MKNYTTISTGEQANDNGDELARCYLSDAELDALAEAELAWERWEQTRRWWTQGCIDDASSAA